jgi:hypothetical protein
MIVVVGLCQRIKAAIDARTSDWKGIDYQLIEGNECSCSETRTLNFFLVHQSEQNSPNMAANRIVSVPNIPCKTIDFQLHLENVFGQRSQN